MRNLRLEETVKPPTDKTGKAGTWTHHVPPASQSVRKGAEDWRGRKGQMDREAYQTSLWVEQDREKGGDRRDSAPGGCKCLLNKSTTSTKSNTQGQLSQSWYIL